MKRPSIQGVLIAGTVMALASGCVSTPPIASPELPPHATPPDNWGVASTTGELASDWWDDFADPGLSEVVAVALQANPDLQAAAARVEQAAQDSRIAASELYPTVSAALNRSQRKQNFIGFPIPGSEDSVLSTRVTTYGVSLDTSWEIDLWGRLRASTRASIANLQASHADFIGARLSLAGQTVKAWFAASEASEQLRLARATVESFQSVADQVGARFNAGLRPSLDYRLALANVSSARALTELRKQQLDSAVRQVEILLGRYPGAGLEVSRALTDSLPEIPAGVPAALVARRPDLAAAERRLVASGELVSVARRARYPQFSLTASGGTSTQALGDLLEGNFSVWSVVGNLVQPIFQGGRLRANQRRAEWAEQETLVSYVGNVLNAYAEVELALSGEAFLNEREEALRVSSEQFQQAVSLAEDRYRAGLTDYITVLDSQRLAVEAQSQWILARRQRLDNRVDLYLALGGGFDRRETDLATTTEMISTGKQE